MKQITHVATQAHINVIINNFFFSLHFDNKKKKKTENEVDIAGKS